MGRRRTWKGWSAESRAPRAAFANWPGPGLTHPQRQNHNVKDTSAAIIVNGKLNISSRAQHNSGRLEEMLWEDLEPHSRRLKDSVLNDCPSVSASASK